MELPRACRKQKGVPTEIDPEGAAFGGGGSVVVVVVVVVVVGEGGEGGWVYNAAMPQFNTSAYCVPSTLHP